MPYSFPANTKFATINLQNCRRDAALADPLDLGDGISIHASPVGELSAGFRAAIGNSDADAFNESTLVIAASSPSANPNFLDHEWQALDKKAFMMFYSLLMHGVPKHGLAATAGGGCGDDRISIYGQINPLPSHHWLKRKPLFTVTDGTLRNAETTLTGMSTVYSTTGADYKSIRRGLQALVEGWKSNGWYDRLHAFVRALDGLLRLPQGAGRREFINRCQVMAAGTNLHDTFDAIYRLRSYDEHLADWPAELAHVAEHQRHEFVGRHAFLVEALAEFAFRTVLSTPLLLTALRDPAQINAYWVAGGAGWPARFDLDTEAACYVGA